MPAHDERDYEFATQFSLPVIQVIQAPDPAAKLPYVGDGKLVQSGTYNGLDWPEAKKRITADLAARGVGQPTVNYKLRDWLFSRQRYWGEPFPIVWLSKADYDKAIAKRTGDVPANPVTFTSNGVTQYALPLPASALPLELPNVQSYLPSGNGESPLANETTWLEIWLNVETGAAVPASQPKPTGDAWVRGRRETNTMPQWAGSCWYYLRFIDPQNKERLVDPAKEKYWMPVDLYVGGAEHAVLHLLYARFWHKVLFDLGVVPQSEPFKKLFHQGMILGEDGEKMSKSSGKGITPDALVASHGADTLRLYEMFLGPLEAAKPWNSQGIEGVHRFLHKVWRECIGREGEANPKISDDPAVDSAELVRLLHETIKKVGDDIEGLRFNTAISQMMVFSNALQKSPTASRGTVLAFLQLVAPFAPHLAEELWERVGGKGSVMQAPWPKFDPTKLVASEVKLVFQVNGKHRGDQLVPVGLPEADAVQLARANPKVAPFLDGKTLKRAIYVPGRILNLVVE